MKSCAAGYTEWLLFHMWQKNKQTNQTCFGLLVPDTVIYRLGKPFFWYFSDVQGEIMRKGKNRVNHKTILEEFQLTDKEILAYYLGFRSGKSPKVNSATIEFFTQTSFQEFIQNPEKCKSGILQRWVQPKSNFNSLLKVTWSAQFCLIERRTNKNRLDDPKVEFYDRLVTYEGLEHNSSFEPVTAPWIISALQQVCLNICGHIAAVTGGNVSVTRMVLFFKHDENDRLWLMFCSALKVMDLNEEDSDQPLEWEELEVSVPKQLFQDKLPLSTKGSEMKKNRKLCVGCNYLTRDSQMYDIPLNLIVKFFVFNVNLPKQGDSVRFNSISDRENNEKHQERVPKVIRRINRSITYSKYREMLRDPAWEHMQVKVCQDCFLHFTQVYSNPEFFKEAPVLATPPKITLQDNSPPSEAEPKRSQNTPSRITYPNIVQNMKEIEHRNSKFKTEPVGGKFSELKKRSRLIKAKSEVKIDAKVESKKHDLTSFPALPPLRSASKSKLMIKRIQSSKPFEVEAIQNNELQDYMVKVYQTEDPVSKKHSKLKNHSKKLSKMTTSAHSRIKFEFKNTPDFIQETLNLLKSTISNLPS